MGELENSSRRNHKFLGFVHVFTVYIRKSCSNCKLVHFEANISLSKPQYYIKVSVFRVLLSYKDKHPSKVQISAKYIRHLMLSGPDSYSINMPSCPRFKYITEHLQYPNLIINGAFYYLDKYQYVQF